jgi:hypothetical protein
VVFTLYFRGDEIQFNPGLKGGKKARVLVAQERGRGLGVSMM